MSDLQEPAASLGEVKAEEMLTPTPVVSVEQCYRERAVNGVPAAEPVRVRFADEERATVLRFIRDLAAMHERFRCSQEGSVLRDAAYQIEEGEHLR